MVKKKETKVLQKWFFPKHNITIKADTMEEATKLLNKKFKS